MSADDPGDEALGQSDQERIANTIHGLMLTAHHRIAHVAARDGRPIENT
jgi:hypothetical protein